MDGSLILRATALAAEAHRDQRRAGTIREPYVNHVIRVANTFARAWEAAHGAPPPACAVAAALLHDVVEDTSTTIALVSAEFGAATARIVEDLTDPHEWSAPVPGGMRCYETRVRWLNEQRAQRKARQADKIRHATPYAALIKIADQTDNVEGHAAELSHLLSKGVSPARLKEALLRRSESYATSAAAVVRAAAANPFVLDERFAGASQRLVLAFRTSYASVSVLLTMLAAPPLPDYSPAP